MPPGHRALRSDALLWPVADLHFTCVAAFEFNDIEVHPRAVPGPQTHPSRRLSAESAVPSIALRILWAGIRRLCEGASTESLGVHLGPTRILSFEHSTGPR
jgi:hypothetical protein